MSIHRTLPLFLLGLSAALAPLARAQSVSVAVGNAGQLHRTLPGTYGELFPEGNAMDAATPVLALEIDDPAAGKSRLIVPGTDDARIEAAARVFHDARYDTFTVLFSSAAGSEAAQLRFATFDGTAWSESFVLEDEGVPVAISGEPLTAVTDDAFDLDLGEDSAPLHLDRRIIHVLWRDGGEPAVARYAPLTFLADRYIGWSDPVVLSDALPPAGEGGESAAAGSESSTTTVLTPELARVLSLRAADDDRAVLATFTDPASQRIGTVVIAPLALAIDLLGDLVRDEIFARAELYDPADMTAFSDKIRAGIVIVGHRFDFHPAHVDYLANQVADWARANGGTYGYGNFTALGNDARDLTIDVSSGVYASLAADPSDPGSPVHRIDLSAFLSGLEEPRTPQIFNLSTRSNRPAPAIDNGPTTVLTSRDGRDLLVAWEDAAAGQLRWVESRHKDQDGAWSEAHSLALGDKLSLADALELLAQKTR